MALPGTFPRSRKQSIESSTIQLTGPLDSSSTEIIVHIYDLLPPSKFSSALWHLGFPLLHTAIYLPALGVEYAFGGHSHPRLTGVYVSRPPVPPPGARRALRLGNASCTPAEAVRTITALSGDFLGPQYDVLRCNCNHFTDAAVRKLLRRRMPGWCNRAATLGCVMPCIVPQEWKTPGVEEMAGGRLVQGEEGSQEHTAMLVDASGSPLIGVGRMPKEVEHTT